MIDSQLNEVLDHLSQDNANACVICCNLRTQTEMRKLFNIRASNGALYTPNNSTLRVLFVEPHRCDKLAGQEFTFILVVGEYSSRDISYFRSRLRHRLYRGPLTLMKYFGGDNGAYT